MIETGFSDFAEFVARTFSIDESSITRSAQLVDDLGFDSLDIFELMIMIEDVSGVPLHGDALASVSTIADAYEYWARRC